MCGCSRPHRAVRTLIVVKGTSSLRTGTLSIPIERHTVSILGLPQSVKVIPHLRDLRAAVVQGSLARRSLVVSCAGAANVRRRAVLGAKSLLEVGEGVGGAVGWNDIVIGEPLEGVQAAVMEDHSLEEVDHLFVLGVLGAIAGDVEG